MKKTLFLLLFSTILFAGCQNASVNNLYPEESISHAHGMAVDSEDPNKVYVATHNGLFVLMNDKDWYRIGKHKDDYMGFSVHPKNSQTFFSSGHSSTSGNLGVQKSEDGGITWNKISDGVNGPVDFHAMAVSTANPDILYGYAAGSLQRSLNGGKDWEIILKEAPVIINFATDSTNENIVFVSTANQGILISNDKGMSWKETSEELKSTAVIALAIDSSFSPTMLSFSEKLGLAKSVDTGETWGKMPENFNGDMLSYIAFDKNSAGTVYALTQNNVLFQSSDNGVTWQKIL